jgi:tRNA(Ile2) C34 agmatinyltransferase TiaS
MLRLFCGRYGGADDWLRAQNDMSVNALLFEDRRKREVARKIERMPICPSCGVRCSSCTRNGSRGKCCLSVKLLTDSPNGESHVVAS